MVRTSSLAVHGLNGPPSPTVEELRRRNPLWGTSLKRKSPPLQLQQEILEFQNYRCDLCGCDLHDMPIEWDHVVPYSIAPNNFVVATCRPCNQKKGASVRL